MLETAAAGGPAVKRAHLARRPDRHLVALAEMCGRIAVQLQYLGQRRLRFGTDRGVSRRGRRTLGDNAHADRVIVAPAEHGRTGRRAERADVEAVVGEAVCGQAVGGRRRAGPPESVHRRVARVIQQNQKHIWRALRWPQWLNRREFRVRILGVKHDRPREWAIRDGQDNATDRFSFVFQVAILIPCLA